MANLEAPTKLFCLELAGFGYDYLRMQGLVLDIVFPFEERGELYIEPERYMIDSVQIEFMELGAAMSGHAEFLFGKRKAAWSEGKLGAASREARINFGVMHGGVIRRTLGECTFENISMVCECSAVPD